MDRNSNLDANALRQKARLRVAAERELREIGKMPVRRFESADAIIDAAKERIESRRKLSALGVVDEQPGSALEVCAH